MSEFLLGQHEAKINAILDGQREMSADIQEMSVSIREIKEILAEKKGERRVALWGVGALSSFFTMAIGYLGKIWLMHP